MSKEALNLHFPFYAESCIQIKHRRTKKNNKKIAYKFRIYNFA